MANDLWETPPAVYKRLNKEFSFLADMAASKHNAKCRIFYTEEDNSLGFDWAYRMGVDKVILNEYGEVGSVFVNPPYSNPMPWVKKAIEAQADGLTVVMLLNADPSVGWWAEAMPYVSEIRFIIAEKTPTGKYSSGRIGFIDSDGNEANGNSKPQCVLVFDPFRVGWQVTRYIPKSEIYHED